MCFGFCFQNVGSVRQLLYDFPWTNVGKLVFVVRHQHYSTLFQHIASRNIFPLFGFFFQTLIPVMMKPKHPLAHDDEPPDRGPGNLDATPFFPPSVLPFYLSLAIPLELIRDLGRLAVPTCSYPVYMFYM